MIQNKISLIDYVLPSDNKILDDYANKNKIELMEQIIHSIEYAVTYHLPSVEIFQFENSDFVIIISEKDYLVNINNIYKYYMEREAYEYCHRVIRLQKTIREQFGQTINNEK